MPIQKDLKRVVRTRMQKTGESYTAARQQVLRKKVPPKPALPDNYAELAGASDAALAKATGHSWPHWIEVLDAFDATNKPHRDAAKHIAALGVPDWWSQSVVVGYERVRGLRERGQRRGGAWGASKSKTFDVPVSTLFPFFSDARKRAKWLDAKPTVRTSQQDKSLRMTWEDGTSVELWFTAKGDAKSSVAVQHVKLPDKESVARVKAYWTERLNALAALL
ncbi:MAG TPA: hypothetical protein VEK11_02345 [Thermoanaerobaculia bacterium]|nr:hypothetical protein [Thermoanaerobaculia bacterium]